MALYSGRQGGPRIKGLRYLPRSAGENTGVWPCPLQRTFRNARSPILLLVGSSRCFEGILELVVLILLTSLIKCLHHMLIPSAGAGRQLAALTAALALTLTTFKSHCTGSHLVSNRGSGNYLAVALKKIEFSD